MSEDKVASFGRLVAGKAVLRHHVDGFTIAKLSEPPAAGRGVFSRVFDHELNVRGQAGDERLGMAKDFIIFLRRDITPREPGNNCAVRERKCSISIRLDRYVVAENGAYIVETALFMGYGNQSPIAVTRWKFAAEDKSAPVIGARCRECYSSADAHCHSRYDRDDQDLPHGVSHH